MHFYSTSSNTLMVSIDGTPNPIVKDPGQSEESVGRSQGDYGGKANLKRCVLSFDLKVLNSFEDLTAEGREFHIFGPATEKALLPI